MRKIVFSGNAEWSSEFLFFLKKKKERKISTYLKQQETKEMVAAKFEIRCKQEWIFH